MSDSGVGWELWPFRGWCLQNAAGRMHKAAAFQGLGPELHSLLGAGRYHAPRAHNSATRLRRFAVIRVGPAPRSRPSSGCRPHWAHTWQKKKHQPASTAMSRVLRYFGLIPSGACMYLECGLDCIFCLLPLLPGGGSTYVSCNVYTLGSS